MDSGSKYRIEFTQKITTLRFRCDKWVVDIVPKEKGEDEDHLLLFEPTPYRILTAKIASFLPTHHLRTDRGVGRLRIYQDGDIIYDVKDAILIDSFFINGEAYNRFLWKQEGE